jgi:hypothetical protein
MKIQTKLWLWASWAILNLFDLTTTVVALKHGGTEANPVMAWIIHQSLWYFVLFKFLIIIPMYYSAKNPKIKGWTLVVLNIAYGLIVLNNLLALFILFSK